MADMTLDDIITQRKVTDSSLDQIIKQRKITYSGGGEDVQHGKGTDTSLDDFIKKRKIRLGAQQGSRPSGNPNGTMGKGRPLKGRLGQPLQTDLVIEPKVVGDARNRIIQKKRLRFRDARDRLAEIAKQGDARDKINMIRKKTPPVKVKKTPATWKNTGLVEKNIRNENRPSDLGGKTRMQGSSLVRTVSGGDNGAKNVIVRGRPNTFPRNPPSNGRTQSFSRSGDGSRYHPLPNNPHVVTIKNDKADLYNPSYTQALNSFRQHDMRPPRMKLTARSPPYRSMGLTTAQPPIYGLSGMRSDIMARARSPAYRLRRSPEPEEIRPTRLKITTANNYREPSPLYDDEWESVGRLPVRMSARIPSGRLHSDVPERLAVRVPAKKRPIYDDNEMEPINRPKKVAPLSSGLMARLDQPQRPAAPQGGKVLVTNLHHCVSVEDMEELFGTIGPILSARMIREGVAEAVFMNIEDAFRSVEVFNNRQLDGQPMCVTVVTKKPPSAATAPPPPAPPRTQTKSVLKAARGRTRYYI
ncbi:uncharacterized protein LOC121863613 isoform X2 [Homarus americanus]|uniref:uncharacterized protein LOC121863613 isoform X2 n=1 Tax=Homarus americanus TaxID=6706 RepID=UPI001C44F192|nr:uncharacterized protein LOC121863613 isoform X2 [Homarus americanus]